MHGVTRMSISKKTALFLSLAVALAALLLILFSSLGFMAPGQIKTAAAPAESAALLTGRDEPDRLPTELLPGETVNINTASAEELQLLPGIGEILSQAIIDYREANGPFESVEAVMSVPGIGQGRFEAAAEKITIGDDQ